MESTVSNRRIISIALFVLAVIMVILGVFTSFGLTGFLVGLVSAIAGIIFYRRGK